MAGGSSQLLVSGLPPISADDFSQLFSQSGCVSSMLGVDNSGMCVRGRPRVAVDRPRPASSSIAVDRRRSRPPPPNRRSAPFSDALLGACSIARIVVALRARRAIALTTSPPLLRRRQVGYVDFPDEASAMTARNFYAGWKLPGQTGAGISLEVRDATRASDALFALIEFIS